MLPKGRNPKGSIPPAEFAALESSVRGLMVGGKFKTALDRAKDAHRIYGTPASEALLIDAYMARIQSLTQTGLVREAASLLDLVRERFPAARNRLSLLDAENQARSGSLDELLAPLNDPTLSPERVTIIERVIQERIYDPGMLASCGVLPAEHRLRQAAAAVQRAFAAVTTGPVTDEMLSLPEVSRRSPLAPWKMLVWALASLYRRDTEACRRYLAAIPADSAPACLIPVIEANQGDTKSCARLTAAARVLLDRVQGDVDVLKRKAKELDSAFDRGGSENRIVQAIRAVITECRRASPAQLEKLKQYVFVRAVIEDIDLQAVSAATGGVPSQDATFHSLYARSLASEDLWGEACAAWLVFLEKAVEEGWFPAKSPEAAAVYLHVAELLGGASPWEVAAYKNAIESSRPLETPASPEALFERASVIDPHPTVFARWLKWAKMGRGPGAEKVAERWRNALPRDIEPLLFLIAALEKRKAFPTALKHLAEAEKIDSLNPEVRKARWRILCANFYKQVQQRPIPSAADKTLAAIVQLPQAQQGDRPAFVEALGYTLYHCRRDAARAETHRSEMVRIVGSAAAALLSTMVSRACKYALVIAPHLPTDDREELPVTIARVAALGADVGLELEVPRRWLEESRKRFAGISKTLDLVQLRNLGGCVLFNAAYEFAFDISVEGLRRGVSAEAEFLLLRARSLVVRDWERAMICALTAASVARQRQDLELGCRAVDFLGEEFKGDLNKFSPEQLGHVLKTEKAETEFPVRGRGPSYSKQLDRQRGFGSFRAARGEQTTPFDGFDEEGGERFDSGGFSPELDEIMIAAMMDGIARDETPEQTVERLEWEFRQGLPFRGGGKGRKKR